MITIEDVHFSYPKAEHDLIDGLSGEIRPGERVAVTGKNGCGKTTLVRLITGILRPSSGRILIDGDDIAPLDLFEIGKRVGCVFQDPSRQLFCATLDEEVRYGLVNMGLPEDEIRRRADRYIGFFRLQHRRDAFPGLLSQGEKQRAVLAAVLAMGPRYIVLDEPTSGLDMEAREDLGNALKELSAEGCGIMFVSHERSFIDRFADREWVMR